MKKFILVFILLLASTGCGCTNQSAAYKEELKEVYSYEYTTENFFLAIQLNNYEAVELFLKAGMDPDTKHPNVDNLAMHFAIQFNSIETIEKLFEYGADPNYINNYNVNYINYAAINNQECETVKALIAGGVDPLHETSEGMTPKKAAEGQLQYSNSYQQMYDCLNNLGY